jgi:hypothetical protein
MEQRSWKLRLVISAAVAACGFVWLNTWNVWPCDDCMVHRGRPFAYKITEGFATPLHVLLRGLLADIAVFCTATFSMFIVLGYLVKAFVANRKSCQASLRVPKVSHGCAAELTAHPRNTRLGMRALKLGRIRQPRRPRGD